MSYWTWLHLRAGLTDRWRDIWERLGAQQTAPAAQRQVIGSLLAGSVRFVLLRIGILLVRPPHEFQVLLGELREMYGRRCGHLVDRFPEAIERLTDFFLRVLILAIERTRQFGQLCREGGDIVRRDREVDGDRRAPRIVESAFTLEPL